MGIFKFITGRWADFKLSSQFHEHSSMREFYNIFLTIGCHLKDLPVDIDQDEFAKSYTSFIFKLDSDDDFVALAPMSNGNLRVEQRFRKPLPNTMSLIVYACFDSILEIYS